MEQQAASSSEITSNTTTATTIIATTASNNATPAVSGSKQKQLLDSLARTQHIVEESHKAIQDNSKRLGHYCTKGDLEGILSLYDSDIELLETQTPICRGIDALRLYYETMKKLRLLPADRCTTELHTLSPFIVLERGKYKIPKSKKHSTEGRYFSLWINRSDWKIIQECRILSTWTGH